MESWITAERAGSLWPLAVADFYLEHMIIQEPGEFEPQDEDQDGDLSRPWSEVMVVPENLTTYVLKDLPPGQINLGPDH